jgi:hypothetical protein
MIYYVSKVFWHRSPNKHSGFDQRDCSSLGSAARVEMRSLDGSSSLLADWSLEPSDQF